MDLRDEIPEKTVSGEIGRKSGLKVLKVRVNAWLVCLFVQQTWCSHGVLRRLWGLSIKKIKIFVVFMERYWFGRFFSALKALFSLFRDLITFLHRSRVRKKLYLCLEGERVKGINVFRMVVRITPAAAELPAAASLHGCPACPAAPCPEVGCMRKEER